MSYDYGTTPISPLDAPMEQPPQKRPIAIIIIVVLVLLCCCCLFMMGAGYWLWNNGDALFDITRQLGPLVA